MNRRALVTGFGAAAITVFGAAAFFYDTPKSPAELAWEADPPPLLRDHAPVIGPADAPVTIVEFFDPSCETCRAFHPVLKEILADFEGDVRIVVRYAALHDGSDEAVRILEAARLQDLFEPVLGALLEAQPIWAKHGAPDLAAAWGVAGRAGLDVARAMQDAQSPAITEILAQDAEDVKAAGVSKTPTFFVNGKPLIEFGRQQLYDLVAREVAAL